MATAKAGRSTATTASMLADIGVGTAAELVMGVRYTTSPPGPTFIPELDTLLLSARPHEGGSSLQRGDLIEVVGPSGSGKTQLAVFILMTSLLPPTLDLPLATPLSVALGGRGVCAASISPRSHASLVPAIERAMRGHIASCIDVALQAEGVPIEAIQSANVSQAVRGVMDTALARLSVLRPKARSLDWVQAFRRLGAEPTKPEVVVCDGFSDGHWPERWAEESKRPPAGQASMKEVWEELCSLRADTGAIVVVTIQGIRPNPPFYQAHLPPPYHAPYDRPEAESPAWPLNIQLTLTGPARALQFPAETTLVDALRSQTRSDVQVYNAIVRVPGGLGEVGSPAGARWSFGIGDDGVIPFT